MPEEVSRHGSAQRAFHVPALTGLIPRLAAASLGSCRNLGVGRVPRPQYHHHPTNPAHRNNTFSLDSPILLLIHALYLLSLARRR